MDRLFAAVGQVILHWCWLEQSLDGALRQLQSGAGPMRTRATFCDKLAMLQLLPGPRARSQPDRADELADLINELERIRQCRNRIAHELRAASASPDLDEPCVWYASSSAPAASAAIPVSELEALADAMHRCRRRLDLLASHRP